MIPPPPSFSSDREIPDTLRDDLLFCQTAVQTSDRDRFLCGVFAPPPLRAGLWAVYALNLELAQIRAVVSDPLPGQIRFQWWREAIRDACADTPGDHPGDHPVPQPAAHPVVRLVAATLPGRVAAADLVDLIEARAADLASPGPATLAALETYLAATSGRVQRMAASVLTNGTASPATLAAATAMGTASGLVGMIRAVAFQARESRLVLPREALTGAGIRESDLVRGRMSDALGGLVAQMAAQATTQITAARACRGVDPAALPALLPCVLAEGYLMRLRRRDWNPFAPGLDRPGPGQLIRLWWRARTGRY